MRIACLWLDILVCIVLSKLFWVSNVFPYMGHWLKHHDQCLMLIVVRFVNVNLKCQRIWTYPAQFCFMDIVYKNLFLTRYTLGLHEPLVYNLCTIMITSFENFNYTCFVYLLSINLTQHFYRLTTSQLTAQGHTNHDVQGGLEKACHFRIILGVSYINFWICLIEWSSSKMLMTSDEVLGQIKKCEHFLRH